MNEKQISKAIEDAVDAGHVKKVRGLIGKSKERLHEMTPFGTWLHIAAAAGHLELVQCLISMGADINIRGGTFDGLRLMRPPEKGGGKSSKFYLPQALSWM